MTAFYLLLPLAVHWHFLYFTPYFYIWMYYLCTTCISCLFFTELKRRQRALLLFILISQYPCEGAQTKGRMTTPRWQCELPEWGSELRSPNPWSNSVTTALTFETEKCCELLACVGNVLYFHYGLRKWTGNCSWSPDPGPLACSLWGEKAIVWKITTCLLQTRNSGILIYLVL